MDGGGDSRSAIILDRMLQLLITTHVGSIIFLIIMADRDSTRAIVVVDWTQPTRALLQLGQERGRKMASSSAITTAIIGREKLAMALPELCQERRRRGPNSTISIGWSSHYRSNGHIIDCLDLQVGEGGK